MLLTARSGGSLSFFFCNLDSAGEAYPANNLWQLVLSIEATSMFSGGLSELPCHEESGLVRCVKSSRRAPAFGLMANVMPPGMPRRSTTLRVLNPVHL